MFKSYNLNNSKKAYSLVEILVGITLFSIIITSGFYAFSAVSIGKIKLVENTSIEKESFFFGERLFDEIKKGGVIDYEEYFNRMVVNARYSGTGLFSSGHYKHDTGFGNFGSGGVLSGTTNYGDYFYLCRSGNGESNNMSSGTINPNGGCWHSNLNNYSGSFSGKYQRFGQYTFQFTDYNGDYNSDNGDTDDSDTFINGDDDDLNLGVGPEVFGSGGEVKELYLISGDKKTRTLFRWNVIKDPTAPTSATCDLSTYTGGIITGSGCLGSIEFLKLNLKDWGINHSKSGTGLYDGLPDTWIVDPNFAGTGGLVAGSNTGNYWVSLFPDTINVKNLKFYLYPNKDIKLSWRDSEAISPYLRISYTLTPSWKKRGGIKGKLPELNFSTTISLSDLHSLK